MSHALELLMQFRACWMLCLVLAIRSRARFASFSSFFFLFLPCLRVFRYEQSPMALYTYGNFNNIMGHSSRCPPSSAPHDMLFSATLCIGCLRSDDMAIHVPHACLVLPRHWRMSPFMTNNGKLNKRSVCGNFDIALDHFLARSQPYGTPAPHPGIRVLGFAPEVRGRTRLEVTRPECCRGPKPRCSVAEIVWCACVCWLHCGAKTKPGQTPMLIRSVPIGARIDGVQGHGGRRQPSLLQEARCDNFDIVFGPRLPISPYHTNTSHRPTLHNRPTHAVRYPWAPCILIEIGLPMLLCPIYGCRSLRHQPPGPDSCHSPLRDP